MPFFGRSASSPASAFRRKITRRLAACFGCVLGTAAVARATDCCTEIDPVLSAALDPRIRVSVPVAGTLPMYLRRQDLYCSRGDWGDLEQHHPLYAMVDYLDLYILGSYGRGRGQLQVLNQYDSCCFWGIRYQTYRDILKEVAADLQRTKYDVFLDSTHTSHLISGYALDEGILPFLRHRRLRAATVR